MDARRAEHETHCRAGRRVRWALRAVRGPVRSVRSWLALALVGCLGCPPGPGAPVAAGPAADSAAASSSASLPAESPLIASYAFATPADSGRALEVADAVLDLAVLHIQTPAAAGEAVGRIWRHVREDVVSGQAQMQLRRNGIRVGIGHATLWDPVRDALAGIEGRRVTLSQPVRLPAAFPLSLELDEGPRDQTLFCMQADGVLNGETWPNSRNVLKVTYVGGGAGPGGARLEIVPEVRQELAGLEYVRTQAGLWRAPRRNLRTYDEVQVELALGPQDFVLIGPSEEASLFGLLGGVLLRSKVDGETFDSYVVLRPEVRVVD